MLGAKTPRPKAKPQVLQNENNNGRRKARHALAKGPFRFGLSEFLALKGLKISKY